MTLLRTAVIRQGYTVHYHYDGSQQRHKLYNSYSVQESVAAMSLTNFRGCKVTMGVWKAGSIRNLEHDQCNTDSAVATRCSTSLDTEAALAEKRVHSSNPALPALSIESGREISDMVLYVELSFSFILGGSVL